MAHLEEFRDDFLFCQVTENLVSHFDALDSDVPEDVRLMHQIHFYNEVGIRIISLISQANLDETAGGSKLERIKMCRDTTAVVASLDYLNTHPKAAAVGV